ncbi:MAG TPA: hypothetical protein VJK48_00450 [Chlamydiales bacterium]|nr:MAG: hypothetical protein A3F67_05725 [Verrucomicrobia bacterium RIFCSPHIGHO2_12_FULL_41_10]HLB52165.1 hypothetical protein [Chlamydiales bacterium]
MLKKITGKKGLGIVILIVGIVLIGASFVIQQKIEAGKEEIASGKEKVAQGKRLFSLVPSVGNTVGDQVTAPGQSRIIQGESDIAYYQDLANKLLASGIILAIAGGIFLVLSKTKKSN